jgi:hypothetical protein
MLPNIHHAQHTYTSSRILTRRGGCGNSSLSRLSLLPLFPFATPPSSVANVEISTLSLEGRANMSTGVVSYEKLTSLVWSFSGCTKVLALLLYCLVIAPMLVYDVAPCGWEKKGSCVVVRLEGALAGGSESNKGLGMRSAVLLLFDFFGV